MNELKNVWYVSPVSAGCLSDVLPYWLLFCLLRPLAAPADTRDKWRTVVTRENTVEWMKQQVPNIKRREASMPEQGSR